MRPLKKTEVCNVVSRRARYKLCKEVDGRFYSVIAGTGSYTDAPVLEYETGRVTESPSFGCADEETPASGLIYAYEDLDDAIEAAGKVGTSEARAHDKRVIFKATPIGFKRGNRQIEGVILCEALLIGNSVWENEPAPPEPVWVDVTDECEVIIKHSDPSGWYFVLMHEDTTLGQFGLVSDRPLTEVSVPAGYKVESTGHGYMWDYFRVLKEDC